MFKKRILPILIAILLFLSFSLIYAIILYTTKNTKHFKLISIILGCIIYFTLIFILCRFHHGKVLWFAILYYILFSGIIILIHILCGGSFKDISYLKYLIYLVTSIAGGISSQIKKQK